MRALIASSLAMTSGAVILVNRGTFFSLPLGRLKKHLQGAQVEEPAVLICISFFV